MVKRVMPWMKNDGSSMTRVMIVGLRPSISGGHKSGVPLKDSKSGVFLWDALKCIGKEEKCCYFITNLVDFADEFNKEPTEEEKAEGLVRLKNEISDFKPNLVLCLGKVVGDEMKIPKSSRLKRDFDVLYYRVMHPAYYLRNGMHVNVFAKELETAFDRLEKDDNLTLHVWSKRQKDWKKQGTLLCF